MIGQLSPEDDGVKDLLTLWSHRDPVKVVLFFGRELERARMLDIAMASTL